VTGSPSAAADAYFSSLEHAREFESRANNIRSQLLKSIRQKQKLKQNLEQDLAGHGHPEEHKRVGDLLLANVSTAKRAGNKVTLTDYYADGAPPIEIELDEDTSLQEEAARRFKLYGKAKRAREEIAERMVQTDHEIAQLNGRLQQLEEIITEKDEAALAPFITIKPAPKTPAKQSVVVSGVRRYLSSDGYEILVGRAARDNDNLTFKIAQPNDLWLHAGDYPGSHVVIRNPTRKEIPHRTIVEAAQLAGRFSQASEDSKVVIHYTPRKFLSKPKGAAPGLVRLSRFKSITVEPKETISRISA
jgi:predicted ribosome quality control (RQC) complex YloA/Tae2 family protein